MWPIVIYVVYERSEPILQRVLCSGLSVGAGFSWVGQYTSGLYVGRVLIGLGEKVRSPLEPTSIQLCFEVRRAVISKFLMPPPLMLMIQRDFNALTSTLLTR